MSSLSENEYFDRREQARNSRSRWMKSLHETGRISTGTVHALRKYGQCEATARSTTVRCKMFAQADSKFCMFHSGRKNKKHKNKCHYYRRQPRRQLYEDMKADRDNLENLYNTLSLDDHRLIAMQTARYINRVPDVHNDGQGLLIYLEQKIMLAAIQTILDGVSWYEFHQTAERYASGTHGLPIKLKDGSYASDDAFTLPRGTKVGKGDVLHGPDIAAGRQKLARMEHVNEKGTGAYVVTVADLADELNN